VVSHKQIHEFIVFHRQKHVKQCFLDQATNEKCSTYKFSNKKILCLHIKEIKGGICAFYASQQYKNCTLKNNIKTAT
jgi:hypothetical protein